MKPNNSLPNWLPQVSTIWLSVALSTRRTDATSPSGVACWRSVRTRRATRPSWRTPTFWPATLQSASRSASFRSSSQKSCPMATTTSTVARKSPKSSWLPSTRLWATTTSTWRELCWNPTCAPLECSTREPDPRPNRSLAPPSPLCAALSQLLFPVRKF